MSQEEIKVMEFCGDHGEFKEKIRGLSARMFLVEQKSEVLREQITNLRIFRAQVIAIVIAGQVIGSIVIHFLGK
jgi:hypothetical protein